MVPPSGFHRLTRAASISASSLIVLTRLTLLVYHLAATAAAATARHSVGAINNASCLPLTMSKRSECFPAMINTIQLFFTSPHTERTSKPKSSKERGVTGTRIKKPRAERVNVDKAKEAILPIAWSRAQSCHALCSLSPPSSTPISRHPGCLSRAAHATSVVLAFREARPSQGARRGSCCAPLICRTSDGPTRNTANLHASLPTIYL